MFLWEIESLEIFRSNCPSRRERAVPGRPQLSGANRFELCEPFARFVVPAPLSRELVADQLLHFVEAPAICRKWGRINPYSEKRQVTSVTLRVISVLWRYRPRNVVNFETSGVLLRYLPKPNFIPSLPAPSYPTHMPKPTSAPTPKRHYRGLRWPDGRILTHPEHFVNTGAVSVKPNDTLKNLFLFRWITIWRSSTHPSNLPSLVNAATSDRCQCNELYSRRFARPTRGLEYRPKRSRDRPQSVHYGYQKS